MSQPTAILIADGSKDTIAKRVAELRPVLSQHLEIVAEHFDLAAPLQKSSAKYAVAMGGDGTILRAARLMGRRQLPVIGVNLGRLGFLADLPPDELAEALPQLASGRCRLVDHLMFDCTLLRAGKPIDTRLVLNEVSVLAGFPFAMLDVQLYVDAELVTTYNCDGLIVSTPVGSTAHNLSAGGPILRKDLQAVVISPISPHTLTNRPVVDSADRVYELAVPESRGRAALVADGQVVEELGPTDRVRISRSPAVFRTVEFHEHSYYGTLREKLGWGRDPRELNHAPQPDK
jgi:NAD+ kinase